jgi:hypothetical protein
MSMFFAFSDTFSSYVAHSDMLIFKIASRHFCQHDHYRTGSGNIR